ncbi:MAG: hypothetical protein KAG18_05315, partial [Sinobacterium sp.]|nr:hypothetical protein [Sinobacterium sp.]
MLASLFSQESIQQLDAFHFLRPEFLYALPLLLIYAVYTWKKRASTTPAQWNQLIHPSLLKHLTVT